jgi:hypothetical protein
MQSSPHLPGYRPVEQHDCTRCARPARYRYAAVEGEGPELEPPYKLGIDGLVSRVASYPGGAIALATPHAPLTNDWFWGASEHCGFALLGGGGEPDSLVNTIYRRLVRHEEPVDRITDFDLDRFLASPFVVRAVSNCGGAAITLVAAPAMLRAILSTGSAPATLRDAFDAGEMPAAELRRGFLGAIGAVTRPLA